jgi:hypothetical protein
VRLRLGYRFGGPATPQGRRGGARKRLDDVGTADDSDESPIEHNGQSTEASAVQNRRRDLDAPYGADRDHRSRHHFTDRGADRPLIFPRDLFTPGEEQMPPWALFRPPLANDQIAVADDTDDMTIGVDDRQATHSVRHHQARGFVDRCRGAHRDDVARHDFFDRHRPSSLSLTISPFRARRVAFLKAPSPVACATSEDVSSLKAGALYFLVVFAAGWVFGPVRQLLVVPRVAETIGVLLEARQGRRRPRRVRTAERRRARMSRWLRGVSLPDYLAYFFFLFAAMPELAMASSIRLR